MIVKSIRWSGYGVAVLLGLYMLWPAFVTGQGPSVPVAMRFGAGAPAGPCTMGQSYFRTDAPVAGANLANCDATGYQFPTVYGASTLLWGSLSSPATALSLGAAACNVVVFGPAGTIRVPDCGPGEDMDGVIHVAHDYAEGTDLHPEVKWAPIDAGAGNVRWAMDYYWLALGEAAGGAPATILGTDQATGGTAWRVNEQALPVISGAGRTINSVLTFRVYRTNASAGEYGSRAALLVVDMHYQKDSLGSRTEDTK